MSLEPENMGMREWLKENVKDEEYVVMKAEVDVLEVMMRRRNMETDVRGYVYAFFSLHYLLFSSFLLSELF